MSNCRWCKQMIMPCPDGDRCTHKGWVHLGVNTTHVCSAELEQVAEPLNPPKPEKKPGDKR